MGDQERKPLIDIGVKQGAVVPVCAIETTLHEAIVDARALPGARRKSLAQQDLLIVLSQDCDIASSHEPFIEIVLAKKCTTQKLKNNDSLKGARNTRKLHFYYMGDYWEAHIDLISSVAKEALQINVDWSQMRHLPVEKRELLTTWRINRYLRAPLPDIFNKIFVTGYLRQPGNALTAFLEAHRELILDLYVYIYPDAEGAQSYLVSVTLLVAQHCPDDLIAECETHLRQHLEILNEQDNPLIFIQVAQEHIPDTIDHTMDYVVKPEAFTMQDIHAMKRLSVDYLCFPE
jgi:hypothetical protein